MRYHSILLAGLLLTLGCGSDATGPAPKKSTSISVRVDWPLAREPGFTGEWSVWEIRPADEPNRLVGQGQFSPSGIVTIGFTSVCREGSPLTGHYITLTGRFAAYEGMGYGDCYSGVAYACTAEPQLAELPPPDPESGMLACRPPPS